MEINWFFIIISFSIAALFRALLSLTFPSRRYLYPPGPTPLPIVGNLSVLLNFHTELEQMVTQLHAKYGPIFTVYMGSSSPVVIISSHTLAHQALVKTGVALAQRPKALPVAETLSNNQHSVHSSFYGPNWRVLRRNLYSENLHASRIRNYTQPRRWALGLLMNGLRAKEKSGDPVVVDHLFRLCVFSLSNEMIFGAKLDEETTRKIEDLECRMTLCHRRFSILNAMPNKLSKILLWRKWREFLKLVREEQEMYFPLIRARADLKKQRNKTTANNEDDLCYVDTLLDIQLPEENNRKLTEAEIVGLCHEFYNAGGDTTITAMHWIMANLVKYPEIQEKLYQEMKDVLGDQKDEVDEEDLQKLTYLKAVVLEGLRRHPPGHFLLPHAAGEDVELGGYLVPKNATLLFYVKDMALDPNAWDDPMEFRPERFLNGFKPSNGGQLVEVTGSQDVKMMPFGAGRRVCPGYFSGIYHLEYFLAKMIWAYKWSATEEGVDLTEKLEFLVEPKYPVKAHISPRVH